MEFWTPIRDASGQKASDGWSSGYQIGGASGQKAPDGSGRMRTDEQRPETGVPLQEGKPQCLRRGDCFKIKQGDWAGRRAEQGGSQRAEGRRGPAV